MPTGAQPESSLAVAEPYKPGFPHKVARVDDSDPGSQPAHPSLLMTSRTAQADQWARQTRPKVRRMLHDLAHERVTTEHWRVIRPHNMIGDRSRVATGVPGSLVGVMLTVPGSQYACTTPAIQTALGPMVIVAVDQNENPPLIQDALAYQMLPARGKVAVIAAKWRPLRRLLIGATERRSPARGRACCAACATSTRSCRPPTRGSMPR